MAPATSREPVLLRRLQTQLRDPAGRHHADHPDGVADVAAENSPYFSEFEDLIREVQSQDIRISIVRAPIPVWMRAMIPSEPQFDTTLRALLDRYDVEIHDFSGVHNDEASYFDSDHLNQTGVLSFFENHLAETLRVDR